MGEPRSVVGSFLDCDKGAPLGAPAAQLGTSRRSTYECVRNRSAQDQFTLVCPARLGIPFGQTSRSLDCRIRRSTLHQPARCPKARGRFGFFGRETQHFPDPVNHPQVSYSTRMRPTGDLNRFFPK